jgi:hypothetical protein
MDGVRMVGGACFVTVDGVEWYVRRYKDRYTALRCTPNSKKVHGMTLQKLWKHILIATERYNDSCQREDNHASML